MSDAVQRLTAIGTVLAGRMPTVRAATTTLLESFCDAVEDPIVPGELHDLLRRLFGWSAPQLGEVKQAWRAVREMARGRTALNPPR